MKLSLATSLLVGAATGALLFACATTEDASTADPALPDAASPPVDAATSVDAADAGHDADAALPACSPAGFCPTVLPADDALRAVWGDGKGVVWAVSAAGGILRWDGAAWTLHATVPGALGAVWGSAPTDVWIGGDKGLYHGTGTSSAALVFAAASAPGLAALPITALWGTSATDVWAAGGAPPDRDVFPYGPARARVLHLGAASGDGGTPWTLDPVSSKGVGISRVWGSAASGVWVAGPRAIPDNDYADEVIVYRKAPGASTFAEIALPRDPLETLPYDRLAKLAGGVATGDGTVWILGQTFSSVPYYWRGTPSGASYAFTIVKGSPTSGQPALLAVAAAGPADAWAVGEYGGVRHGSGLPGAWPQAAITRTGFPITATFHGVWAAAPGDVWAVGDGLALHLDPAHTPGGAP
ncbi:MAG: Type fimbrial biosis protein PilY1 [Labilithrix sp.]|nr:Type fimbrial biosis protein PilY1 [Labilithrix sp.]